MSVQFIETDDGKRLAVLPEADYRALIEAKDENDDLAAVRDFDARAFSALTESERGFPRVWQIMIHAEGWCRRPALMSKPLSLDLRRRIVRAVEEEGMSRRAAAARFGVAPSTAVELVRQWKATGNCEARPQGGDRRSAGSRRIRRSFWLW